MVKSGRLSSLQLEAISYACQTHDSRLPNGSRAGFFIGDGAGVRGETVVVETATAVPLVGFSCTVCCHVHAAAGFAF